MGRRFFDQFRGTFYISGVRHELFAILFLINSFNFIRIVTFSATNKKALLWRRIKID
jgi:hypothetical protein